MRQPQFIPQSDKTHQSKVGGPPLDTLVVGKRHFFVRTIRMIFTLIARSNAGHAAIS